jgi:hypothetical protein
MCATKQSLHWVVRMRSYFVSACCFATSAYVFPIKPALYLPRKLNIVIQLDPFSRVTNTYCPYSDKIQHNFVDFYVV